MASGPNGALFASDDDDEPSSSENDLDVLNPNDDVLNEDLEDEELDEEDEEEEDINSLSLRPPPAASATTATSSDSMAVLLAIPAVSTVTVASVRADGSTPDRKRQRGGEAVAEKKTPQFDESRKLFQRLWNDEDEIELLQGFLEYTAQRGNSNSHHHDTALFYDQIRSKLQLEFNKNQLVEKMRRLKKKYRNVMSKIDSGKEFFFKTAHDQATFEISRKIWSTTSLVKGNGGVVEDNVLDDDEGNVNSINLNDDGGEKKTPISRKRVRTKPGVKVEEKKVLDDVVLLNSGGGGGANNGHVERGAVGNSGGLREGNVAGLVEETVRNCLSPLVKEFMNSANGGVSGVRGLSGLVMPLNFGGIDSGSAGEVVNEKWRKQQILELEVYSKRLELVQDQIQVALRELRSNGG